MVQVVQVMAVVQVVHVVRMISLDEMKMKIICMCSMVCQLYSKCGRKRGPELQESPPIH